MRAPHPPDEVRLRVGISSCLLGEEVRWDGSHKRDRLLTQGLAPYVELVPVCPELELGLGVPRPPIRLERSGAGLRLVEPGSGHDLTREMEHYANRRVRELEGLDLCGYVLKSGSPSCGMEDVEVWRGGAAAGTGTGAFAAVLMEHLPNLPLEEERRLGDAALRKRFIERIFAYHRRAARERVE